MDEVKDLSSWKNSLLFTIILVKVSFKISLNILLALISSSKTFSNFNFLLFRPLIFFDRSSHFNIRDFKSCIRSAAFLFSAAVLMIMPKFLGLMLSVSLRIRFRSFAVLIFLDTLIWFWKGHRTKNLPGIETSAETLAPLVEMGSFSTWTINWSPFLTRFSIWSVLTVSSSKRKSFSSGFLNPLFLVIWVYFLRP